MTVGVISDTHGLLREEALAALSGSDVIVHAGDVGDGRILERLAELAPVRAVRGNTDRGSWAAALPMTDVVSVGPADLFVLHDIEDLDLEPAAAGIGAVIFGHSHRPEIRRSDGVLYFNPGAAGHRRFDLPITVGRIAVSEGGSLEAYIVDLEAQSFGA